MSSRRQKLLARVHWYLLSSLKHITELITGIESYYRGGRYRQVSLYINTHMHLGSQTVRVPLFVDNTCFYTILSQCMPISIILWLPWYIRSDAWAIHLVPDPMRWQMNDLNKMIPKGQSHFPIEYRLILCHSHCLIIRRAIQILAKSWNTNGKGKAVQPKAHSKTNQYICMFVVTLRKKAL